MNQAANLGCLSSNWILLNRLIWVGNRLEFRHSDGPATSRVLGRSNGIDEAIEGPVARLYRAFCVKKLSIVNLVGNGSNMGRFAADFPEENAQNWSAERGSK